MLFFCWSLVVLTYWTWAMGSGLNHCFYMSWTNMHSAQQYPVDWDDVFQFLWSVTSWPAQLTSRLSTHRSAFCSSRGIISRGAGEEDKGYRGHWEWLLCSSGFQIISGRHQGTSLALSLPILFAFRLISIYSFIWFPFAELCSVCLQMKWFPLNSVCSVHLSSGSWKACARWWAAPGLVHSLHRQLYWIWSRQHSHSPLKLDY